MAVRIPSCYSAAAGGLKTIEERIIIGRHLFDELTRVCVEALPHKAYGLVGGTDGCRPRSIYRCSTNLRNTPEWKATFDSFGEFYTEADRGFVISPAEFRAVMEEMEGRNESFVGIFHSHRCRCAEPSEVDLALSTDSSLLCYIVSVVDPARPEVGIFRLNGGSYEQIPIEIDETAR